MSDTLSENEKHDAIVGIKTVDDIKDASNLDAGAKYLLEHPEHADYTPEEARKVLWKIDLMLMPIMTVLITLAAADKILISNAAAYGMRDSVGLVGNQYSWLGSIFYFGYLAAEFPANFILQKAPIAKTLIGSFMFWNVVLLTMAASNSFGALAAQRFLMGMGETFLFPFCSIITSQYYRKSTSEQGIRTAIWFSGFSSVITGLLSFAIGHAHSKLENWRLLFLSFGSITIFFTIIGFFMLPDSPMTCWWLNDRQKYITIHRTVENRTGIQNVHYKKYQIVEALTDWRTWVMALFTLSINISNGSLVTFAAQIVSGLGYTPLVTTALGVPTGLFMTTSSWLIAFPQIYYPKKYRTVFASIICCVPLICAVLMMKLTSKHGLLVAYYFFYFFWGPYVCMNALNLANTSGHTKKTTINAINFTSYCVSNIIAPQFFMTKEAPTYRTGYRAILSFTTLALLCLMTYGTGCYIKNKRLDAKYGPAEDNVDSELDLLDLTDKEKEKWFRYVW